MDCSVPKCKRRAMVRVILYDVYPYGSSTHVFYEEDFTCPYLCAKHVTENEYGAKGVRQPRGCVRYPFTNQHAANGFSVYLPLEQDQQGTLLGLLEDQARHPATRN